MQKEESGILLIRDSKWITGVFNDSIDRPVIRYLFNEEPRAWFALLPPPDDNPGRVAAVYDRGISNNNDRRTSNGASNSAPSA